MTAVAPRDRAAEATFARTGGLDAGPATPDLVGLIFVAC
jgi:hypothetical protein